MDEGVESSHEINCAGFWDALVLKHLLEGNGVRVRPPQEEVFLTLTASGPVDVINAAVAELAGKYPRSGPFIVDGMKQEPSAALSSAFAEDHPPPTHLYPGLLRSVSQPPPNAAAASCAPCPAVQDAPFTPASAGMRHRHPNMRSHGQARAVG